MEKPKENAKNPCDCLCHGKPHLECPNYNPELFGHYPFDQSVEIKPRAGLFGRTVTQVNFRLLR